MTGLADFMKRGLSFLLPALMAAGILAPAPAVAECYDPPGSYVIWAKCDFARKNFEGANLKRAVLEDAVLHHSRLKGANLEKADLRGADLSNADLSGVNLRNIRATKAIMKDTNLSGADLSGADLTGANLERANLTGAKIDGAKFAAVRMSGGKPGPLIRGCGMLRPAGGLRDLGQVRLRQEKFRGRQPEKSRLGRCRPASLQAQGRQP